MDDFTLRQRATATTQPNSSLPSARRQSPANRKRFHFSLVRVLLAVILLYLLFLAYRFFLSTKPKPPPPVIHASRYSKDHKYRPAASPVITEILKDGRTRLRGAHPTA